MADYFVHESSYIDEPVEIGEGTQIWHFSHVMKNVVIGKGCRFGQNVLIASGVKVGNNVKVQNNVSLYAGVELEDDVFCGPSMVFTNILNPRSAYPRNTAADYLKTVVGRGASIGANATVVCGHNIGTCAFVGAGAVVTKNVPDYGLVVGCPAKLIGWMCACGERLPMKLGAGKESCSCSACGARYERSGEVVTKL